jgi:hypothetical protein
MKNLLFVILIPVILLSFTPLPAAAAATLSAIPATITPGGTVTATWSGIEVPTPRDWIGLYVPGAPDTDFEPTSWMYVSCSQNPGTAGKQSGTCPLVLPSNLVPGAYELRLFANDAFTRLATSGPFTVATGSPILITSFKINNGAGSTASRTVTLNFTTGPRRSGDPNPAPEAFRAVEGGNPSNLQQRPFVPLTSTTSASFTLALRGQDGARYGGRPILLQVKSGSHFSNYVLDAIRLDPVVRNYTTGFRAAIDFARLHGYSATETQEITDGIPAGVDPTRGVQHQICSQCPTDSEAQAGDRSCTQTTTIIFFTGQDLKPFWRLTKVEPHQGTALPIAPNVFRWIFSRTQPPDPSLGSFSPGGPCFPFPGTCAASGLKCLPAGLLVNEPTLTFQGPTEDEFVDLSNPWKNAFAGQALRMIPRPPLRPR